MPATEPSAETVRTWLKFVFAPGLGALPAARLLAEFGTPESVLAAGNEALQRLGLSHARMNAICRLAQGELHGLGSGLECVLEWGEGDGHAILIPQHPEYPQCLKTIPVPPPVLYRVGRPLPAIMGVAVVGARKATAAGCETARSLARQVAGVGLTVVSGMARGIDAAAHEGALEKGGLTVAVLGCGADTIYPRSNAPLYRAITERGTILSEFPPGTSPRKHHFPQRNRLISGLSSGTVVVEAGLRSGSLSTARHALEQGREVFAVPGSVHSPNSRGPHQLIRDGAHLVEDVHDILNNLPSWSRLPSRAGFGETTASAEPPALRPELLGVWEALESHPLSMDELIERLSLPAPVVSAALSELEVEGHARMESCGYARCFKSDIATA